VAWVYAIDDTQRTLTATGWKTLTWDEARRIANGIAKLPRRAKSVPNIPVHTS